MFTAKRRVRRNLGDLRPEAVDDRVGVVRLAVVDPAALDREVVLVDRDDRQRDDLFLQGCREFHRTRERRLGQRGPVEGHEIRHTRNPAAPAL